MGIILFISLERPISNLKDNLGGRAWARVSQRLNNLARNLGLLTFDDLTSCSPEEFAEHVGDSPDGVTALNDFQEGWFDAQEGVRTVQGLLDHLHQNPTIVKPLERSECVASYVIEDLQAALKILRTAVQHKVGFHFSWAV